LGCWVTLAPWQFDSDRAFPGEIDALRDVGRPMSSKPICRGHEAIPKQNGPSFHQVDRGFRVMLRIINALYEEYCQARLDEMLRLDAVK
jgi:hypothetical protein